MSAYFASPACNPSRAAMMTGIRPHNSGLTTNAGGFVVEKGSERSHSFAEATAARAEWPKAKRVSNKSQGRADYS